MSKQEVTTTENQQSEILELVPSTLKNYITLYNPTRLFKDLRKVRTVRDAIASKTPTVGESIRIHGTEGVEAYIGLWLIDLNMSVNLKRPLNESQMDFISMQISDKYRNLKIADIYIIFMGAKCGDYGELYERLSPDKVLLWFSEYFETRLSIAGEISRTESDENKQGGERQSPVMQEVFKRMGNVSVGVNSIKQINKKA